MNGTPLMFSWSPQVEEGLVCNFRTVWFWGPLELLVIGLWQLAQDPWVRNPSH